MLPDMLEKEAVLDFNIEPWAAYKFDSEDIHRLCSTVSLYTQTDVDLAIKFSNGNSVSSQNASVCLEDSNNLTHSINNLSIRSSNYKIGNVPRTISIEIKRHNVLNVVEVRGSGPRSAAVVFRTEIERHLVAARLWYSFIYYSPILHGIILMVVAIGIYEYLIHGIARPIPEGVQVVYGLFSAILVTPIPFVVTFFLPRAVIAIGLGKKISAVRNRIGYFILVTVGLGLAIGVGGNFLTDAFKNNGHG